MMEHWLRKSTMRALLKKEWLVIVDKVKKPQGRVKPKPEKSPKEEEDEKALWAARSREALQKKLEGDENVAEDPEEEEPEGVPDEPAEEIPEEKVEEIPPPEEPEEEDEPEEEPEEETKDVLTEAILADKKFSELRDIGKELGVSGRSKADLIERILGAQNG